MVLAEMIIQAGADVNIKYGDAFLIHHAVRTSNVDSLRSLCKGKVDVNMKTAEGLMPLQIAIDAVDFSADLIRMLLRAGADILHKVSFSSDSLPCHVISKENGHEILKILIEDGSCIVNYFYWHCGYEWQCTNIESGFNWEV